MLRINLLPAYIAEKRKTTAAWWAAGTVAALLVAAPLLAHFLYIKPTYDEIKSKADKADEDAKRVEALRTDATNERAKIAPIKAKVDFVTNVRIHNVVQGQIYRNVARYTYKDVEYSAMSVQGDGLNVQAFVPKLADVGRFYLTLFGNPDIKALSIKGMPDWRTVEAQNQPGVRKGYPIAVTAQLVRAVEVPVSPVGQAGGGGGFGPGGMPGGMMGSSGMMMGGGGMRGAGGPAPAPGGGGGSSRGGKSGMEEG